MQRRKLQATGGTSLTLTLPKSWTNRWGLASKDEVLVDITGPALVIKPAPQSRPEIRTAIAIAGLPEEWILREIIGAYIAGADVITLTSDRITPAQNQAVRAAVSLLFGVEILEETSARIMVRAVLDDARFDAVESTRRMLVTVRGMFEDALRSAHTGDKELAADVGQRDFEVNKLLYAIKRQSQATLSGKVAGDVYAVSYYRNVGMELERIGDHAVKMAALASRDRTDPVKLSDTTFPAIQDRVHQLLHDVEAMLRRQDIPAAHQILDTGRELEALIQGWKRMKQSYEGALIEDSLDRLRGYLMNIAELTIDYGFLREPQT